MKNGVNEIWMYCKFNQHLILSQMFKLVQELSNIKTVDNQLN